MLPCVLQSPLNRSTSRSSKGFSLHNSIEFGKQIEAERPFKMNLLIQFSSWGWQVTVSSSKRSIPVKTEAGLWFSLLPLLSALFFVFKPKLHRKQAPVEDLEMVFLWARQCSFLFTAAPGPTYSEFVNLFYMIANVTARETTSTIPSSSPLESHHDICSIIHALFSEIAICKTTINQNC